MSSPIDPRVRTVLEAVATAMNDQEYDCELSDSYILNVLFDKVRAAFPPTVDIHKYLAARPTAGPRTPEDARFDPRVRAVLEAVATAMHDQKYDYELSDSYILAMLFDKVRAAFPSTADIHKYLAACPTAP